MADVLGAHIRGGRVRHDRQDDVLLITITEDSERYRGKHWQYQKYEKYISFYDNLVSSVLLQ